MNDDDVNPELEMPEDIDELRGVAEGLLAAVRELTHKVNLGVRYLVVGAVTTGLLIPVIAVMGYLIFYNRGEASRTHEQVVGVLQSQCFVWQTISTLPIDAAAAKNDAALRLRAAGYNAYTASECAKTQGELPPPDPRIAKYVNKK